MGAWYQYGAPPSAYGAPPLLVYGEGSYGAVRPPVRPVEERKESKFGMGTGLAVGAVEGILGVLALSEGVNYIEDKIGMGMGLAMGAAVGVLGGLVLSEGVDYIEDKIGKDTGLAVGAATRVLGGLALFEGVDYIEDKITDDAVERVEDDLRYNEGGFDDDDLV